MAGRNTSAGVLGIALALVACSEPSVDVDGGPPDVVDGGPPDVVDSGAIDASRDAAPAPCFERICASDIVSNGASAWHPVHPESDHDAPSETIHDAEIVELPLLPEGGVGASSEPLFVTIVWRSYHRAMNVGTDGGHCGRFCGSKEVPFAMCSPDDLRGYDGVTLKPDESGAAVWTSGEIATEGCVGWIEGPYQNDEEKWEWREDGAQSGIPLGDQYECSTESNEPHDWAERPVDILRLTYRVSSWDGLSAGIQSSYELRWDEGDSPFAGGNDDFDLELTPSLPSALSIGNAIDQCLQHGSEGQRFTLQRDAVLMLCETGHCDEHLFEVFFDVQCQWQRGSAALDSTMSPHARPPQCF